MRKVILSLALALSLLFVWSLDGPVRRRVLSDRLLTAAILGNTGAVRVLLALGADANAKDEEGETSLMLAAQDVGAVRLLLAWGADVNAKDASGETPLLGAVREDALAVVRLLLASGADVNAADEAHHTALMSAAYSGQTDIVRLLIARGARLDIRDEDGHTAIWFARWNWRSDIVELLKENAHGPARASVRRRGAGGRQRWVTARGTDPPPAKSPDRRMEGLP
jgi:ankyrin repeat protein